MTAKAIIFDMDGTLADSFPGIYTSFCHTLKELDFPEPGTDKVRVAIGPGLHKALEYLLGESDPELIERGAKIYRSFHDSVGFKEATLYPGISDLLSELKGKNAAQFVASMRNDSIVKPVLAHLDILDFFVEVLGSNPDQGIARKAEMIKSLAQKHNFPIKNAVLVGDTAHDAKAAKEAGVDFFAVTYGYGFRSELEEIGYSRIFDSVAELSSGLARLF